jgi:hypothetical protein
LAGRPAPAEILRGEYSFRSPAGRSRSAGRPPNSALERLPVNAPLKRRRRRLLLNLRLIEAPIDAIDAIDAIDYVITRELSHLEEPNHGSKFFVSIGVEDCRRNTFFDLVSCVLPDWRQRRERFERIMA